jgi:Carboxypeptidase regulatory-like domain/TonB dependent receptor-like, beta-barrel
VARQKTVLCTLGLTVVLLLIANPAPSAFAQTETASIRGSVSDSSGALIPNGTVRLVDVDRGSISEVATGRDGSYNFPSVRPGRYHMEVKTSGFKPIHLKGVIVNVQDKLEENFKLAVGAASETITVEENAINVNTTDATVSTVVDRHFAEELPLNGRSFQTLIMLTPGVVVTSTAVDDQGQFSVNGQRADGNYFTVDGVSANFGVTGLLEMVQSASGALPALSAAGGTNSLVSVDAMQEFRVQTSSFAPEFGRMPGGQISIVTRSGTNDFHGTLFEYFRNGTLDDNDWFANFNHLAKPDEKQNDFGGVFGGPLYKDKTFFFFSYEGLRLRQPLTAETVVPDAVSRQQAPAGAQAFLNAYPVANGPELGAGLAQFNAGFSNPSSLDAYSLRVDQVVNSKISLFGRYSYSPSSQDLRAPFPQFLALSSTESLSSSVQTLTVGLTELINPRISNEVRTNYSNQRVGTTFAVDNFGGAAPIPDSLVFPSSFSSTNSLFEGLILGSGELAKGKFGTDEQRQLNLVDNLSAATGRHQLKFGVDYRWLSPFSSPLLYGQFAEFTGVTSSPGGALSGTAAFADTQAFQGASLLAHNLSLYGQDAWKVTPRLTVTYGLRWELNPPLKGKTSANDPFTVIGLNDPATMTLAPRGTPLYQTTYGNVAPRLGIAYQLNGNPKWGSVLRAGAGVFYDLGQGSLGGVSTFFPFFAVKIVAPAPFPLSPQNASPPVLTTNPPASVVLLADPHLKLPRTYQWNVALEQSLGREQNVSLTYVGATGRDLLRVTNLLNVNPDFQSIALTDNSATSDYHALQMKYQRRLSKALQALASYTFSHSSDNASTDAFATELNTPAALASPHIDRGDSDFDIRHSFTAGVTYDLPAPGSRKAVHALLGGWSLDGFVLARSAPPVGVVDGIFFAAGTALHPRPNLNPGVPLELRGSQYPGGKIFNSAAFTAPPVGQQGDFGRNVLRGFGASQIDLGLQKQFHFSESVGLRFRAEFFNLFNHPNFGNPNNDLTSPLFGHSTQTLANSLGSGGANGGFNPLYQIGGPRSIQLALKLQF